MQFFYRIVITLIIVTAIVVVVSPLLWLLFHLWTSQISIKQSLSQWLQSKSNAVAIIDPNKIYQNGKEVGNVTGLIETKDNFILFHELCDTSKLKKEIPFQYKTLTLKITHIDKELDVCGSPLKKDVKRGAYCDVLD